MFLDFAELSRSDGARPDFGSASSHFEMVDANLCHRIVDNANGYGPARAVAVRSPNYLYTAKVAPFCGTIYLATVSTCSHQKSADVPPRVPESRSIVYVPFTMVPGL